MAFFFVGSCTLLHATVDMVEGITKKPLYEYIAIGIA